MTESVKIIFEGEPGSGRGTLSRYIWTLLTSKGIPVTTYADSDNLSVNVVGNRAKLYDK